MCHNTDNFWTFSFSITPLLQSFVFHLSTGPFALRKWKDMLTSAVLLKVLKQAVVLVIGVVAAMAHNSNLCNV